MKKSLRKLVNTLFAVAIIVVFLSSCQGCSVVTFNSVNDYKGSLILKIEQDSVGSINTYIFYIKTAKGRYEDITIKPEYAKLFNVGDTI